VGVERRATELWREFLTLKAYERWSIWLGHKTAIMPRFFQFRPWEVNLFTHYQLSCSSPLGIWPVEMGFLSRRKELALNVLVHCFAATLYFPVIIIFFFFLQIKVCNSKLFNHWSTWAMVSMVVLLLSVYNYFCLFVFHCTIWMPYGHVWTSDFHSLQEEKNGVFSCIFLLLPRNGKKDKCGLTPNPVDGTGKDERMQVLR